MPPPPLPNRNAAKRFQNFARASWISIIIAFVTDILIQAGGQHSNSRPSAAAMAVLFSIFPAVGLLSGITALFGVRRHGRKGILWPAVIGIGIWVTLFALSIPVFLTVRSRAMLNRAVLAPVQHLENAATLQDSSLGFSLDIPAGFQPLPQSNIPAAYRYVYIKSVPHEPNRVLCVKVLGGPLPPGHITPQDLPPGQNASITAFSWRGLSVDGFRVPESQGGFPYLTFNVDIPLRVQAIQIGFGGPAQAEGELRDTANQVLSSLAGETNWSVTDFARKNLPSAVPLAPRQ